MNNSTDYSDSAEPINLFFINDTPTLTSPVSSTVLNRTVTFSFPIYKGANSILLQVSSTPDFSSDVSYETSPESPSINSISHTFSTNGDKYWRIKAGKNFGWSY